MFKYQFVNGSNEFDTNCFNEMCNLLEQGRTIKVGIDCIGHGLNNAIQEEYKKALIYKYGEKLVVGCSEGVCSYSYYYSLDKVFI